MHAAAIKFCLARNAKFLITAACSNQYSASFNLLTVNCQNINTILMAQRRNVAVINLGAKAFSLLAQIIRQFHTWNAIGKTRIVVDFIGNCR